MIQILMNFGSILGICSFAAAIVWMLLIVGYLFGYKSGIKEGREWWLTK